MGEVQFLEQFQLVPSAGAKAGRGPFAHSVHREEGSFLEGRREKSRSGMGLVMFRKNGFAGERGQLAGQSGLHPNLVLDPNRDGLQKRGQSGWGVSQVTVNDPVKLEERLFVKGDMA